VFTIVVSARERELEEVLAIAQSDVESSVLVVGPSGSGKTHVLRRVEELSPIRSVFVTPHPDERDHPLSGLSMVLSALGDTRLAEFVGRFTITNTTPGGVLAAASDVLTLLRGVGVEPIAVIVDDLDLLDEQSQSVLAFMVSRLTGTGLRIVGSVSPPAAESRFASTKHVTLSRLSVDESLAVAVHTAGSSADLPTLKIVSAASGGLPGALVRNIDRLSAEQRAGRAPLSLPLHMPKGASVEIADVDESCLLILQRISTAPLTSMEALPPVADDDDHLERLIADGLVELHGPYVSLRDAAVRSALYWSLPARSKREHHDAAAKAEAAASPALAQWHASYLATRSERAGELLSGAANLVKGGYISAAVELTERAIFTSPDLRTHVEQLCSLGVALIYHGELGLVSRYMTMCKRAATTPHDILRCVTIQLVAHGLAEEEFKPEEIDVYVTRYSSKFPVECAQLLSIAAAFLASAGRISRARANVDQARRLVPDAAPNELGYWAGRLIDAIDGNGEQPHADRRSELPDLDALSPAVLAVCGTSLTMEERSDDARSAYSLLAVSFPQESRTSPWTSATLALSAENEIRAGNFHEASSLVDELAYTEARPTFRNLMLFAWQNLMAGRTDDARPFIDEASQLARTAHHSVANARLMALQGSFALMRGDIDDATYELERAVHSVPDLKPNYLRVAADHAEALFRSGERLRAQRAVQDFATAHTHHPSRWSHVALRRAIAIVSEDDSTIAAFEAAMKDAAREPSPYELARTRLSYSINLDRLGKSPLAREQRQTAELLFDEASAIGWAQAVRELAIAPEPEALHPMLVTLTDDELAVLRLIRRGARNKDIAAALFVSLRTVEVRITQIYRKLDARSRSHLLALLPAEMDETEARS
jgi:DNA-binding NarL/FixJ family response regulator